jgi:hypothetical protein
VSSQSSVEFEAPAAMAPSKTVAGLRKTPHPGVIRFGWMFHLRAGKIRRGTLAPALLHQPQESWREVVRKQAADAGRIKVHSAIEQSSVIVNLAWAPYLQT